MIGTVLSGRYRIDELIGKGGMAIVYRATDLRTRRMVAVKVLREEYLQNEEFLQRFDREAMVCAKTSHANIVNLLDIGEEEDKTRYLVMEYVKGRTLKEIIVSQGCMDAQQAVQMTLQILSALSHAHQRHIIHRDMKPQNMLVDENGHVKVADFGIARMTDAKTMTIADGNVMGSVHYFSPEQAKGEQVTETSDLYSVGVMLYEMLSGHVPFDGDTPVSVAMKHLTELPKPLGTIVTPALEQVVQKALCKQINQRYQSADEMARDLRRALRRPEGGFVNMRPVESGAIENNDPLETEYERRKPSRRKRLLVGLITAMVSVLVVVAMASVGLEIYRSMINRVMMPDLIGLDEANAIKTAESAGLLTSVTRRSDASVAGLVIEQTPVKESELKRGDPVLIVVSDGPGTVVVPTLTGMTREEAVTAIANAGLVLGEDVYDISEVLADTVFMQEPLAGTPVMPGSLVDLYISQGLVIVSDLESRREEEAKLEIERLGLVLGEVKTEPVDSLSKDGVVIAQSPLKFEETYPGAKISITVGEYDKRRYSAQITLGLELPEDGANVRIALVGADGKETDQFQWNYTAGGKTEINVKLRSETSGKLAYRVYIDNAFHSETPVNLQLSESAAQEP